MRISQQGKWNIKTCNGFGILFHGFKLPNGCLFGTRRLGSRRHNRGEFYFVCIDLHDKGNGCYNVFMQVNEVWKCVTVDPHNSDLARELADILTIYKGTVTTFRDPKAKGKRETERKLVGLKECLPSSNVSANYRFIERPGHDQESQFAFQDHTDAACGVVNPYCWSATFKNRPQVSFKRQGKPYTKAEKKEMERESEIKNRRR